MHHHFPTLGANFSHWHLQLSLAAVGHSLWTLMSGIRCAAGAALNQCLKRGWWINISPPLPLKQNKFEVCIPLWLLELSSKTMLWLPTGETCLETQPFLAFFLSPSISHSPTSIAAIFFEQNACPWAFVSGFPPEETV